MWKEGETLETSMQLNIQRSAGIRTIVSIQNEAFDITPSQE